MKKKSPPYAIIGAVILGIACVFLFIKMRQSEQAQHQAELDALNQKITDLQNATNTPPPAPPPPTDTRNVYYATQPVEAGAKISPAFFEKKATPTNILPDAFTDKDDIVGFYAIRPIENGDPLTPRNIGRSLPYLSQRIPPGMRSISLQIFNADANFTGGFVVDGDRVDLLYSTFSQDNSLILRTETIIQNLDVLFVPGSQIKSEQSAGITPIPPPGEPIAVTFLVTPEEAQMLTFLSQVKNGHFSMILKSRQDKLITKIKAFDGTDYAGNLKKIQSMVTKSDTRVAELAKQIQEQEKNQGSPGNTNETTPPPPTP